MSDPHKAFEDWAPASPSFPFYVPAHLNPNAILRTGPAAEEIGLTRKQFALAAQRTGNLRMVNLGPGSRCVLRRDLYRWIHENSVAFRDLKTEMKPGRGRKPKKKADAAKDERADEQAA